MLTYLWLQDFQAWRDYEVAFDSKITTFVGPTDIGKSSLIRALKWIMLNKPRGDEFIHWDGEQATASIEIDGRIVERVRGKENLYLVDGEEYKAFGNNVPDSIVALLKVKEVNFQGQLDAPFWLALSPFQVSRELDEIINLEVIDKSLSWINAKTKRTKTELDIARDRYKASKKEVQLLQWVKQADADLKQIEKFQKALEIKRQKQVRLQKCLDTIEAQQAIQKRAKRQQQLGVGVLAKTKELQELQRKHDVLSNLTNTVIAQRKKVCRIQKKLDTLKTKLHQEFPTCPICSAPLTLENP